MQVTIDWNTLSGNQWHEHYLKVIKPNLIQSVPYAQAIRQTAFQSTRFGLIKQDGKPVGLVQIQEIKILKFMHYVFLDRGPLWFSEDVLPELIKAFFEEFDRLFPRRFGRKRRILPEIPLTSGNEEMMRQLGFQKSGKGYHSVWVNVTGSEKELRARFTSKWRNHLKNAEKHNLEIIGDTQGMMLKWFLPDS